MVTEPHQGTFKPLCVPPIEGTRWWLASDLGDWLCLLNSEYGLTYPETPDCTGIVLLADEIKVREAKVAGRPASEWSEMTSPCKTVLSAQYGAEVRRPYLSPIGPPLSLPGRGSLLGAELPVVRRRSGYLRVGKWLAWHRVLGVLDYQPGEAARKWVVVGDDGLYLAEFVPTAKEPLEEFGEVGYVKVVAPYEGDVDDVASPCGAPRLVACTEETADMLRSLGHKCKAEGGVPHVVLGSPEEVALGREAMDWPLADTCQSAPPEAFELVV